ncbi:MAG: glycine cleavage system protein GcvH [Bacteroidia bacterium]|nr:glycine cleavage system protein GcvH [Bacteroidia bacterium]
MNVPENLLYTEDHEWLKLAGNEAYVGITEFAQSQLGDIVFIEIETEGMNLAKHETFGTIEAVKTVSDMFMPVSGEVLEVNSKVLDHPEIVNSDSFGEGWMIKISLSDPGELKQLLSPADYRKHTGA